MFCKATLLTVALGLMASATPITTKQGIRIPLGKRATLQNEDGTFNYDKAVIQTVNTIKYVRLLLPHSLSADAPPASTART